MPYLVRKVGDKYAVVKKSDGKVIGTHPTAEKAMKQIIAIKYNEKRQ